MLNDSMDLYFQFSVVAGTFNISLNEFTYHDTILSTLMVDDYILKRGDGKRIWKNSE